MWTGLVERTGSLFLGNVFTLAGGAIVYSAKKQNSAALFSTEVEYIVLVQVAKESIWIQRFIKK